MDLIIENDGLDLIGIKIFGYLSPEDTFKCCFVSKSWQVFIIANKKRLGGTKIMSSNLEGLVKRLLQCTCPYHTYCLQHRELNLLDDTCCPSTSNNFRPKPVDCFKAYILLKVFNIEELLLKSVIKGWVEFFEFLLPYAKNEGIDFNSPLSTIQEEPYNKRPLLHNLVCTEHCNSNILGILFSKLNVDVFKKDGDGCRAIDLAISQIPMDIRVNYGLRTFLRPDFDITFHYADKEYTKAYYRIRKSFIYYSAYLGTCEEHEAKKYSCLTLIRNSLCHYM